ncbi:copper amine oxidase N-terminal domain-containing protein [Anaerotignum sp. MB30-C6]|uniref:copper amine oxidase N-terminal domain-containing protein n=1 Tax=Anaerotignum sp. MB30-C6 TaxID=3070814 RepID=UPI0027DBB075|nr:copper amine oxidase N-terminal domain-containing protein [Anaerotignum sp. MB30-C6]WMI82232.1 stalk domain-containing protein [Anaerotignum sp. MB30-C6]
MKKGLTLFFAFTLALTVTVTPVAAKPGNGNSNVSSSEKETKGNETKGNETKGNETKGNETKGNEAKGNESSQASTDGSMDLSGNADQKTKTDGQANKKVFKDELNEQKKALQKEKSSLNQQLEDLQLQYENMLASGDEAGAASMLDSINALNEQIQGVQAQIKETINERYMVVKTMYTDEELAEFTSAKDLISQMYADAEVLSAGSVTINNNLIKFDAPAYIKNGVTLVPFRAISEELGGEVSWNAETQTVTITNGDTVVQITANSTTGTVNGETIEIGVPATKTCGKTYVPLRFLAEALGLNTEWDSENDLIDISDNTETTGDTSAETPAEGTTIEE